MKPLVTMRDALADADLFGRVLVGPSWALWRVLLIAICGEPLRDDERVIYESLTGRAQGPSRRVAEAFLVIGRRAGKTRAAAVLAAYLGALCDHSEALALGERGSLPIMSASLWQAGKALEYLNGIFNAVPALKAMVIGETADGLRLSNGVDIECRPANYRTARSMTAVAVIADEVAFWQNEMESRNPDRLVLGAVRPALATTGGTLVVISQPYAQRGELWDAFRRDYGPDGDPRVLVAKAPSLTMNPATLPPEDVERAYERDADAAKADYGGEFRSDIAGYIEAAVIEAAVARGVALREPVKGVGYVAWCDPAGGNGQDSMTLAVAHREGGKRFVLDVVLERRPPFDVDVCVAEFSATLKCFGLSQVTGDGWGNGTIEAMFRQCRIVYMLATRPKSEIYRELLPLLNSKQVGLLDNKRLVSQFCSLERRTTRGVRESIDHPERGHDDLANAAAGAITLAALGKQPMRINPAVLRPWGAPAVGGEPVWWPGVEGRETAAERWQRAERDARKLHTIRLDSDDPIPEKYAYMSASSFRVGGWR